MIDPTRINRPEFLTSWYGPPNSPAAPLPPECEWLPEPLKEWYILSSRWSEHLSTVKRFVAPEKVTQVDGKAIFLKDATGDWRWAFDIEHPEIVYDAELYENWRKNEENLDQFITHSAVQDAISRAPELYWHTHAPEYLLEEILAPLTEIDFQPWRWPSPDYHLFMGDLLLAEIVPDFGPPGHFQVQVAGVDRDHLSYLDDMEGIDWRKISSQ